MLAGVCWLHQGRHQGRPELAFFLGSKHSISPILSGKAQSRPLLPGNLDISHGTVTLSRNPVANQQEDNLDNTETGCNLSPTPE